MKEKVLELKAKGYNQREISQMLNLSKSSVSYHCNPNEPAQTRARTKLARSKNAQTNLQRKVDSFRSIHNKSRKLEKAVKRFTNDEKKFNKTDVLEKFSQQTVCYLTGEPIDLLADDDYSFDHIVPKSRGGDNSIENLGITKATVNYSKHAMTDEEYIQLCLKVVKHAGYEVKE